LSVPNKIDSHKLKDEICVFRVFILMIFTIP